MKPDEAAFESHIAEWLAERGGYAGWKLDTQSADFDAGWAVDTAELFAFIEETQPDEWAKVLKTHTDNHRGRLLRPLGGGLDVEEPGQDVEPGHPRRKSAW